MSSGSRKRPDTLDLQPSSGKLQKKHKRKFDVNKKLFLNVEESVTKTESPHNENTSEQVSFLRRWFHFERTHNNKQPNVASNEQSTVTSRPTGGAHKGPSQFTKSSLSLNECVVQKEGINTIERCSTQIDIVKYDTDSTDVPENIPSGATGFATNLLTFLNKLARIRTNSYQNGQLSIKTTQDISLVTETKLQLNEENRRSRLSDKLEQIDINLDDINDENKTVFLHSKHNSSIRNLSQARRRRSSYYFTGNLSTYLSI